MAIDAALQKQFPAREEIENPAIAAGNVSG